MNYMNTYGDFNLQVQYIFSVVCRWFNLENRNI